MPTTNPLQTHTQVQPRTDMDAYQAAPSELINHVVTLMREKGVALEKIDLMLSDNMIARTRGGSLEDQRCALNVFWQIQLGNFGNTTFKERNSLVVAGTERDWTLLFERYVLPVIIDLELPVPWSK